MRREDRRLVSIRDIALVGQELADQAVVERTMAVVTVGGTITGQPVRVFPDCPEPGQYTIEVGMYSFTFPGELERVRKELSANGIELSSKDVVIQ